MSTLMDNGGDEELTLEIYKALMGGDHDKVIQLCGDETQKGGLHNLTIHRSTVLHMAAYAKDTKFLIDLLNTVPTQYYPELTCQSDSKNTILHEAAAASNYHVPAARKMLCMAPADLLSIENERGETPLFRAARYGKGQMFRFLDDKVKEQVGGDLDRLRKFLVRNDNTTILHAAILTEHFALALRIAKQYGDLLIPEKDKDGMTALQLLACNPSAFRSGNSLNILERLLYYCASVEFEDADATEKETEGVLGYGEKQLETDKFSIAGASIEDAYATQKERSCRWPLWDGIRKKKKKYESALELANLLIKSDKTWEHTESAESKSLPTYHPYRKSLQESKSLPTTDTYRNSLQEGKSLHRIDTCMKALQDQYIGEQKSSKPRIPLTPLLLATRFGCIDIVKGILDKHPQAVSHVDYHGRNILHVAIKHRQFQILDIVEKKKISMRKLRQKLDYDGNSILHMVGAKTEEHIQKDMRSPAVILQEDLLLLKRIKNICPTHHTKHLNSKRKTAEMLLAESNVELHKDAKEWMKRTAEHCSIVAVLIATVAFAAAYTVPGGPNDKGYPILESNPFFVLFTITDVLSLGFALTSVITFLSILTSPFRLKDFKRSLPQKLMVGVTLLILSVSMMMLAFAATVILTIRNKEKWTRIFLYAVSFFPVAIFAVSYLPLYMSLTETFKYSMVKKIGSFLPRCRTRVKFVESQASVDKCCSQPHTICCLP